MQMYTDKSKLTSQAAPVWARSLGISEAQHTSSSPIVRVLDPTPRSVGVGRTNNRLIKESAYSADVIHLAHLTESIIREVTNKYTDLISKPGFEFVTKDKKAAEFIHERLLWISRSAEPMISFKALLKETSRDYVGQGNAFWVKVYANPKDSLVIGGKKLTSVQRFSAPERGPLTGYFRVDPRVISPRYNNQTGRHNGWIQKTTNQKEVTFRLDEIIHFAYQRPAGEVLGVSMHRASLDDIRALRDQEEYAIKLMEKMLFPVLHHQLPATGDDQYGLAEDMDQAVSGHQTMSPDGILITPHGHELKMIGAAGQALDPTPQLKYMMQRVFMGEGVSGTIMGQDATSAGTSDVLTTQIHNRVKSFQEDIEETVNLHLIMELLMEAGFKGSCLRLVFGEIEIENQIRLENHATNQFTNNMWTEDEARGICRRSPLSAAERRGLYVNMVEIPRAQTEADIQTAASKEVSQYANNLDKSLATHASKLSQDPNLERAPSTIVKATPSPLKRSKPDPTPKVVVSKASPAQNAAANKNNPANQHGSRGSSRASKTPAAGHASKNTPDSAK